jgi:hypothetical protein
MAHTTVPAARAIGCQRILECVHFMVLIPSWPFIQFLNMDVGQLGRHWAWFLTES